MQPLLSYHRFEISWVRTWLTVLSKLLPEREGVLMRHVAQCSILQLYVELGWGTAAL